MIHNDRDYERLGKRIPVWADVARKADVDVIHHAFKRYADFKIKYCIPALLHALKA